MPKQPVLENDKDREIKQIEHIGITFHIPFLLTESGGWKEMCKYLFYT